MDEEQIPSNGAASEAPHDDAGAKAEAAVQSAAEAVRRLGLASVGAVAVAGDVAEEIFSELVTRGEKASEEVRREVAHVRARRAERRRGASIYFRSRMDALMNRFNLPSKGDVDSINAKLNILTRKVDEVQAGQVEAVRPVEPVSNLPEESPSPDRP